VFFLFVVGFEMERADGLGRGTTPLEHERLDVVMWTVIVGIIRERAKVMLFTRSPFLKIRDEMFRESLD
jgi:hypothetical protein